MTDPGRDPKDRAERIVLRRFQQGQSQSRLEEDLVAAEEPLEIRVRGRSVAVTMRTPGNDEELAAGFLFTEGIIQCRKDVLEIAPCREGEAALYENTINVFLAPGVEIDFGRLSRHLFASSSCGLCGKASIESIHQKFPPLHSDFAIAASVLVQLPERLRAAQTTFLQTGGLHAAAVFDESANPVVIREDIGRHNAVDKVLGYGLLAGLLPFAKHVLMVSGRVSFEIIQKALAAGIPLVAAISAPSSLAVEFAKESGQGLAGFLREGGFNLYANPERVRTQRPRTPEPE